MHETDDPPFDLPEPPLDLEAIRLRRRELASFPSTGLGDDVDRLIREVERLRLGSCPRCDHLSAEQLIAATMGAP